MVMTVPRLSLDELVSLVEPDWYLEDDGCAAVFAEAFASDEASATISEAPAEAVAAPVPVQYPAVAEPAEVPAEAPYDVTEEACGAFAAFMAMQDSAVAEPVVPVEVPIEVPEEACGTIAVPTDARYLLAPVAEPVEGAAIPVEACEALAAMDARYLLAPVEEPAAETVEASAEVFCDVPATPVDTRDLFAHAEESAPVWEIPGEVPYEVPEEACEGFAAFMAMQDSAVAEPVVPVEVPIEVPEEACGTLAAPMDVRYLLTPVAEPAAEPVEVFREVPAVPLDSQDLFSHVEESALIWEIPREIPYEVPEEACEGFAAFMAIQDSAVAEPAEVPAEAAPAPVWDEGLAYFAPAPADDFVAVPAHAEEAPVATAVLDAVALSAAETPVFGTSVVFSFGQGDGARSALFSFRGDQTPGVRPGRLPSPLGSRHTM